jgi:hypothetical protein
MKWRYRPDDRDIRTSYTSVDFNGTTPRYIPQGCYLHTRRHENLKSRTKIVCALLTFPIRDNQLRRLPSSNFESFSFLKSVLELCLISRLNYKKGLDFILNGVSVVAKCYYDYRQVQITRNQIKN